ncbi:hypothetical protein [uncultured Gammaproteobacteria bacterium]|jgi:hypothetical protein|nr:hypothetical protein [uncultured Gammaproteobacteria bacterium]CAC9952548.1 hypothetical protein [uncultured Gammaproteobacteria bacterium]
MGDYIEFYNHQRFYKILGCKKPMDVHQEGGTKSRKGEGFLNWAIGNFRKLLEV